MNLQQRFQRLTSDARYLLTRQQREQSLVDRLQVDFPGFDRPLQMERLRALLDRWQREVCRTEPLPIEVVGSPSELVENYRSRGLTRPRLPKMLELNWVERRPCPLPAEVTEFCQHWGELLAAFWNPQRHGSELELVLWPALLGRGLTSAPQLFYQGRTGRGSQAARLAGKIIEAGAWQLWLCQDRIILLLPPRKVFFEQGRPHRLDGPAIVWPNGESYHAVGGQPIPAEYLKNPETISLARVLNARDRGHREGLLRLVGYERLLRELPSRRVDHRIDANGHTLELFEIPLRWGPVKLLRSSRPGAALLRQPANVERLNATASARTRTT